MSNDDGRRWSAASRFRLKELEHTRTKLALLELGIDDGNQQQQQPQQEEQLAQDGGERSIQHHQSMEIVRSLLRAQSATSTATGGGGRGQRSASTAQQAPPPPQLRGDNRSRHQPADGGAAAASGSASTPSISVRQRPLTVGDIRRRRDENWQQPTSASTPLGSSVLRGRAPRSKHFPPASSKNADTERRCSTAEGAAPSKRSPQREGMEVEAAACSSRRPFASIRGGSDPIASLDASIGYGPASQTNGWLRSTPSAAAAKDGDGRSSQRVHSRPSSQGHGYDAYHSLAVDDLYDHDDVFDLDDHERAVEGNDDGMGSHRCHRSSSAASSTSSSSSTSTGDDRAARGLSCVEKDGGRNVRDRAAKASSSMSSRESLRRMQLEIERYELSESLAALMTRRKALQAKKEEERERRALLASQAEEKIRAFTDNSALLSQEMNAEWTAYRSKLDAERRALRLRQCPGGDDGIRKKFFKTKFASPWQMMPVEDCDKTPTVNHQPNRCDGINRNKAAADDGGGDGACCHQAVAEEDRGIGFANGTMTMDTRRRREEDRAKIANLPHHMRDEILLMRTSEVTRCAAVSEPASRQAITDTEHRVRGASVRLLLDGLVAESCQRNSIASAAAADWSSMVRHEHGVRHKLQISAWMPTMFQDRAHLMARAAADVVPPAVQTSLLQDATEAHRKSLRATWDAVFRLREELIQCQRRKMKLKDELKFARTELQCFAPSTATTAVCPREVAASQRVQILELQVTTLEEQEQSIKAEIEWKQTRVW